MTSTNSASDLLKFFTSLVFTVLVDLVCASASVEHVRRDLVLFVLETIRTSAMRVIHVSL